MTNKKDKKRILVNAVHPEECRVAIVNGEELEDIHIESASVEQTRGNIYKAVVVRVEPSLQAAFVEFDKGQKHGFLQFREISPEYYQKKTDMDKGGERPKIQDVISKKQELLVQVEKDARDMKGASLTTYISLAGRYLVMMPGQKRLGISRKIEGSENRDRIREIFKKLEIPEDSGFIVRTTGLDQDEDTLRADLKYLRGLWEEISRKAKKTKAPNLVHREHDVVMRAIRDYLTDDVDEILIDNAEVANTAKEYFKTHIPKFQRKVKQHRLRIPLFSRFGVEEKLARMHNRRVLLPSGGSIVIDTGEALTAIDVNSGKTRGEKGIEELALKTNLEAAEKIARHLRLRDLGGLIVIDFIDMRPSKNRIAVEQALRKALKSDKAKIDMSRISKFGLLEMSRQRLRPSLDDTHLVTCPACGGRGTYKAPSTVALDTLRELQALVDAGGITKVSARLSMEAANYLVNNKRAELLELEKRSAAVIAIEAADVMPGQYKLIIERDGQAAEERDSLAAEKDDEIPKKKRRSRKKHSRTAVAGSGGAAAPAREEKPVKGETTEITLTADTDEKGVDVRPMAEETAGEGEKAPRKKGRRRRSRRKKFDREPGAETADNSNEAIVPAAVESEGMEKAGLDVQTGSDEPKRKTARKRSRRKTGSRKKSLPSVTVEETQPADQITDVAESAGAEREESGKKGPSAKRTRRRAKQKTAPSLKETGSGESV